LRSNILEIGLKFWLVNRTRAGFATQPSGCPDIDPIETRMRVDQEPAEFDTARQVPLMISFEDDEQEQRDIPVLG